MDQSTKSGTLQETCFEKGGNVVVFLQKVWDYMSMECDMMKSSQSITSVYPGGVKPDHYDGFFPGTMRDEAKELVDELEALREKKED